MSRIVFDCESSQESANDGKDSSGEGMGLASWQSAEAATICSRTSTILGFFVCRLQALGWAAGIGMPSFLRCSWICATAASVRIMFSSSLRKTSSPLSKRLITFCAWLLICTNDLENPKPTSKTKWLSKWLILWWHCSHGAAVKCGSRTYRFGK